MSYLNNPCLLFIYSFILFGIFFTFVQYSYSQSSSNNSIDIFLDALIEKGDTLVDETKYKEAIEYYDRALEIAPDDIETLFKKGNALYMLGQFFKAIQYFDKILEINPTYIDALDSKGKALYELGRYDEAIQYYDKALEVSPNYIDSLNNKGKALYELDRYDESLTYYDKILEISPNYKDALNNKGISLANLDRYNEAIQYFDKVLKIDPNYIDTLYSNKYQLYRWNWKISDGTLTYKVDSSDSKFKNMIDSAFNEWEEKISPLVVFEKIEFGNADIKIRAYPKINLL